jgi:PAS domain S-box-containing protein
VVVLQRCRLIAALDYGDSWFESFRNFLAASVRSDFGNFSCSSIRLNFSLSPEFNCRRSEQAAIAVSRDFLSGSRTTIPAVHLRQVEGREWWLWGSAVGVTLVLTFGILSLTLPGFQESTDSTYSLNLKEWVRGLAALVLLFDIYTIYQQLQIQRIRRQLAEREQLFQLITENAADMIAVIDRNGQRLYNSPAYQKILGYEPKELAATSSMDQIHPDDRARVLEASVKARNTGRGERLEYRIRHKDGSWRFLESTSSVIQNPKGENDGLVIVNRDITERKRAEERLAHQSFHDGLTGLPNRALFLDRLKRAITVSRRHSDFKFAVLFVDIDEFKVFNDSLGHAAGDNLLMQIAQRLTTSLRGVDTISRPRVGEDAEPFVGESTLARPGGDEFTMLLEELHGPSDAIRVAERIQRRLAIPFNFNGQEIVLSVSIGIAFSNKDALDAQDVLRDAEIAMYRAKSTGKARCEVFDHAMHAGAIKRLQLETDLRKGVELNQFRVYYQPIVSLRNDQIVGFETLSRWQRPEGLVMPGEFIAVADETGIILPINRQLLYDACRQLRSWQKLFPSDPPLTINVNITPKQFAQPDLASQIRKTLQETGLDPCCLNLEITETIAMADADRSAVVLSELKALGILLDIDDFGTGYSSLSRLQRFPVDTLKIDRSFISHMDTDIETREIVRIIVMLAHGLRLKVVAEGVETPAQANMLKDIGCELAQGYLYSKPAPAETIEELLSNTHAENVRANARAKAASSTFA